MSILRDLVGLAVASAGLAVVWSYYADQHRQAAQDHQSALYEAAHTLDVPVATPDGFDYDVTVYVGSQPYPSCSAVVPPGSTNFPFHIAITNTSPNRPALGLQVDVSASQAGAHPVALVSNNQPEDECVDEVYGGTLDPQGEELFDGTVSGTTQHASAHPLLIIALARLSSDPLLGGQPSPASLRTLTIDLVTAKLLR